MRFVNDKNYQYESIRTHNSYRLANSGMVSVTI